MTHTETQRERYRRLTQRDIIRAGDEYRTNWGTWQHIEHEYIGKRKGAVFGWYLKMRRKAHYCEKCADEVLKTI